MVFGDCGAGTSGQQRRSPTRRYLRPARLRDDHRRHRLLRGPDLGVPRQVLADLQRRRAVARRGRPAAPLDALRRRARATTTIDRDLDTHPDGLAYFYYWDQPLNGPSAAPGGPLAPPLKGSADRQKAFLDAAGTAFPRMANFSFDYGNAHWTVLDANAYVDWTDPALRAWVEADLAAGPGRRPGGSSRSTTRLQLVEGALRRAADAGAGPGVRGGQGRRRLQRPRPQLPADPSRSGSPPSHRAADGAGRHVRPRAARSAAAGRSTRRSTADPHPRPTASSTSSPAPAAHALQPRAAGRPRLLARVHLQVRLRGPLADRRRRRRPDPSPSARSRRRRGARPLRRHPGRRPARDSAE